MSPVGDAVSPVAVLQIHPITPKSAGNSYRYRSLGVFLGYLDIKSLAPLFSIGVDDDHIAPVGLLFFKVIIIGESGLLEMLGQKRDKIFLPFGSGQADVENAKRDLFNFVLVRQRRGGRGFCRRGPLLRRQQGGPGPNQQ